MNIPKVRRLVKMLYSVTDEAKADRLCNAAVCATTDCSTCPFNDMKSITELATTIDMLCDHAE